MGNLWVNPKVYYIAIYYYLKILFKNIFRCLDMPDGSHFCWGERMKGKKHVKVQRY